MANFEPIWTDAEVQMAVELISRMSAREAAEEMTIKTGRLITRSSLIGRLHRLKHPVPKHCKANTLGNRASRPRGGVYKKRVRDRKAEAIKSVHTFLDNRNKARLTGDVQEKVAKALIRLPPLPPRYKPKAKCQYIDDEGKMCEVESMGPWCDHHKAIVFKPEIK